MNQMYIRVLFWIGMSEEGLVGRMEGDMGQINILEILDNI